MNLTFRSDIVWPWGLFFSQLAEFLSGEIPALRRVKIDLVMGDLLTVQAIADGKADVAFTTPPACVAMGYRGVGYFNKKLTNLRAIGSIPHDDRMVWAVPADSQILPVGFSPRPRPGPARRPNGRRTAPPAACPGIPRIARIWQAAPVVTVCPHQAIARPAARQSRCRFGPGCNGRCPGWGKSRRSRDRGE